MFPAFLESQWDYLFVNWANKTNPRNNDQGGDTFIYKQAQFA